jgi:hypothetical protein
LDSTGQWLESPELVYANPAAADAALAFLCVPDRGLKATAKFLLSLRDGILSSAHETMSVELGTLNLEP